MTRREQQMAQRKLNALVSFLDSSSGPQSASSLSRSYGVDEARVIEILQRRGRLQDGKSAVSV